jgi:hypothetical protein
LDDAGVAVDNLIGVDSVRKPFANTDIGPNVDNVVAVDGTPSGSRNGDDNIEAAGRTFGRPKPFKPTGADVVINVDAHHNEFTKMFNATNSDGDSAAKTIEDSYKKQN